MGWFFFYKFKYEFALRHFYKDIQYDIYVKFICESLLVMANGSMMIACWLVANTVYKLFKIKKVK